MARSRLCRVCGDWHDLNGAWPSECNAHFGTVSEGSGPYVISDNMAPIRSMADGKMYDSKSRYSAEVRARGCRIVGNDNIRQAAKPLPSVRGDLRRALQQLS